jgi:prepilin-type processing-associated H-X9-DG protein
MRLPRLRTRTILSAVALVAAAAALVSLAGVWVARARDLERREQCRINLWQLSLALVQYGTARGALPYGTLLNAALPPEKRLSFYLAIDPWLDNHQGQEIDFQWDRAWDSRENLLPLTIDEPIGGPRTVSHEPPRFLQAHCPGHEFQTPPGVPPLIDYVGVAGLGRDAATLPAGDPRAGAFGYDRRTRMEDFKDGRATTMILVETGTANGPWTAGGPSTVRGLDPSRQPYIGRGRQFGGLHCGGVNVAFADGSVRFLSETIDPKVFEALSTIAGGEALPEGWRTVTE